MPLHTRSQNQIMYFALMRWLSVPWYGESENPRHSIDGWKLSNMHTNNMTPHIISLVTHLRLRPQLVKLCNIFPNILSRQLFFLGLKLPTYQCPVESAQLRPIHQSDMEILMNGAVDIYSQLICKDLLNSANPSYRLHSSKLLKVIVVFAYI